ncbi:hypothetical protein [Actinokineospora sp. HUAS TT18]|uniref:hypothetical protein n=1 Tax=Actinokineospora sp. HUAS TT18 TaxID=3447451 RepID=UPI003F521791
MSQTRPLPTPAEYPKIEPPTDRDAKVVVAALRELDPCALLDPAALGAQPQSSGPRRCSVANGGDLVSVTTEDKLDRARKFHSVLIDLGGAKAYLMADPRSGSCQVGIPVSFELAVTVAGHKQSGDSCASTQAAASVAVDRLGSLVIPAGEPDSPDVGACVDYPYSGTCQPSEDRPVPRGAETVLAAAAGDARVACGIAKEGVSRFGKAFAPVLGSLVGGPPHCYFVEPTHTVVIEVSIHFDSDLTDQVHAGQGQSTTVAGRQAISSTTKQERFEDRRLCLLPVPGAKKGLLCVVAHFLPGRGVENSQVDTTAADQLEPAVEDIVERHFK